MGEVSEDYESAMIGAYLAQREAALPGLAQSGQKTPALEPGDPGLWVAAITFQAVRRIGPPLSPKGIPGRT